MYQLNDKKDTIDLFLENIISILYIYLCVIL